MVWLRQHGAWLLLVALLGIALLGAVRETFNPPQHDEATTNAVAELVAGFRPGDAVVVRPLWDDGLHDRLTLALRDKGLAPGGLSHGERIDLAGLLRFQRVWVLSRFGAGVAIDGLAEADGRVSTSTDHGDGVELAVVDLADAGHLRSLTDDIATLDVARRLEGGRTTACKWQKDRHQCGAQAWLNVRREARDVFHRDFEGVFAHAGPDGATLSIKWRDVPRSNLLLVRAGFTQASTRNVGGAATAVRTLIDGAMVDEVILQPYEYTLASRPIVPQKGPPTMDVSFEVWSTDSSWRQVMLQADLFSARLASLTRQEPTSAGTP